MKIAMPVEENYKDICPVFGRTPFFMIYNTETKEKVFQKNPATDEQGGAGIKAAQSVVDAGVNVLITPRCGENAAEVFQAAGIQIYKSEGTDADENLASFEAGTISRLEKFHGGYHGIR